MLTRAWHLCCLVSLVLGAVAQVYASEASSGNDLFQPDETTQAPPAPSTLNPLITQKQQQDEQTTRRRNKSKPKHHHQQQQHNASHRHRNRKHKSLNNATTSPMASDLANSASGGGGGGVSSDLAELQRDYVTTTAGKSVQLDCKMKDKSVSEDDKIVWLRMPKGEVLALNGNHVTADHRIRSKCMANMSPCWSLTIDEAHESDSGFYVCQTNAMRTKYVYLDVMVPPRLLTQYPVDRIDVNQSSNASLTCEVYGKPEPTVKWYKYQNGQAKEIDKYRGLKTLNIHIHKDSPSEFECVADNSIPPTISKKIFLNIQCKQQQQQQHNWNSSFFF